MLIIACWFVLSLIVGGIAGSKGRSAFGFFLLSFLLSPLLGFIIVLCIQPNTAYLEQQSVNEGIMKKCPYCAEPVKKEAIICKHCGKELPIEEESIEYSDKTCNVCNEPLRKGYAICDKCGHVSI